MPQDKLDNWSVGDPLKAGHLQQVVDRLNKIGDITGGAGMAVSQGPSGVVVESLQGYQVLETCIAQIRASGPTLSVDESSELTGCSGTLPDFQDRRYWLARQMVRQRNCNNSDTTLFSNSVYQDEIADYGMEPFPAENMWEVHGNTHFLLPGEIVKAYRVIPQNYEYKNNGFPTGDQRNSFPQATKWVFSCAPRNLVGEVVCHGPCGESDFLDNRYWVRRLTVANLDKSQESPLLLTNTSVSDGILYPCDPCAESTVSCQDRADNRHAILVVTNLAEDNCKTHNALPGTKVAINWTVDAGGTPRYWTSFLDENMCGKVSCPPPSSSSSNSSSSGNCCHCISVQWTGDTTQPEIEMTDAGGNTWTSNDDQSFISLAGDGTWSMTLTTPAGDSSLYSATAGPCPPTTVADWTFVSVINGGGAALIAMTCGCGSSSSGSSSSGSSSGSSGSGSGSGSCTPICGLRYNLSSKCFEYSTDGTNWNTVENACASPCSTS